MRVQPVPTGGLPVAFHTTTWGNVPMPVSTSGPGSVQPGEYLAEHLVDLVEPSVVFGELDVDLIEAPTVRLQGGLHLVEAAVVAPEHGRVRAQHLRGRAE